MGEPRTRPRRVQGSSYLQRWSALSSKGVSFSRNSKAQLTSSVKSYKEPERPSGFSVFFPTHSLRCGLTRTPLDIKAYKSAVPTHWLPVTTMGGGLGHRPPWPPGS